MSLLKTYLVEDSAVIRENLIATLEELAPLVVIGSADGEPAALQWLDRSDHRPDLLIIDIFLKAGSGLGLLRALQARQSPCRRVVLSNYVTGDMHRACLALGADRVFDKSRDIEALIEYCNRLARGELAGGPA